MATEYDLGNVMGPQGIQGPQGVSISNSAINHTGRLIITLRNGNTIDQEMHVVLKEYRASRGQQESPHISRQLRRGIQA